MNPTSLKLRRAGADRRRFFSEASGSVIENAFCINSSLVRYLLFKQIRIRVYLRPSAVKQTSFIGGLKKLLLFDHFA
jgi:hypothetical protein